jgi:hypothetical protein
MDITFVDRSRFLAPCEEALRREQTALDAGGTIRVPFEDGGYDGRVTVTIRAGDATSFGTDWTSNDETRFPARIRAAATALLNCGCTGQFLIVHTDGVLEISRA